MIPFTCDFTEEFLPALWSSRERAYVNEKLMLKIQLADPDETFVHIERIEGKPPEGERVISRDAIYAIWRKKEWETTYAKWMKDKAQADLRVLEHNKYNALKRKVSLTFQTEMGMSDPSIADSTAEKLLQTSNKEQLIEKIRMMIGVTIEIKDEDL